MQGSIKAEGATAEAVTALAPSAIADPQDVTLGELLAALDAYPDRPLVFHYEGRAVRAGYHVTEVKAGRFAALDCGGNPESWTEVFVQLWDVDEGGRQHMAAGKFARIMRKVSEHVGLDAAAKLTFEVSDGVAPMRLHRAAAPGVADGAVHVELSARPASCKPRDRWLREQEQAQERAQAGGCCGPADASKTQPCCG
jgi:hypothetical protein